MTSREPDKKRFDEENDALARHRDALRSRFPMPAPTPRKPSKALGISALLVLLGAGAFWADPEYSRERYSTTVGQPREWQLADGSRLTLDSASRVEVSWHLRSRRVDLHEGRALFDVSHTLLRPFSVQADRLDVHVLGTLFSVEKRHDEVEVTLVRGKVDVTSAHDRAQLSPGQRLIARAGVLGSTQTVDGNDAIAWKDHKLVFQRTPLSEVLATAQRYRAARIVLDDPALATLPITGVFDSANVENLLALLPNILPVALSRDADGTLHLRPRPPKK